MKNSSYLLTHPPGDFRYGPWRTRDRRKADRIRAGILFASG
jgi:hypothetical protein